MWRISTAIACASAAIPPALTTAWIWMRGREIRVGAQSAAGPLAPPPLFKGRWEQTAHESLRQQHAGHVGASLCIDHNEAHIVVGPCAQVAHREVAQRDG